MYFVLMTPNGPVIVNDPRAAGQMQSEYGHVLVGRFDSIEQANEAVINAGAGGDASAPRRVGTDARTGMPLESILAPGAPRVVQEMEPTRQPATMPGGQNASSQLPTAPPASPQPNPQAPSSPPPTGSTARNTSGGGGAGFDNEPREARSRDMFNMGSAQMQRLVEEAGMAPSLQGSGGLDGRAAPIDINPELFPELMNPDGSMRTDVPNIGGDQAIQGPRGNSYDNLGGYDPFDGTWAADGPAGDQSVMNMILAGQMTPHMAAEMVTRNSGYDNFAFQDSMEQMYATYPGYYNMMNPGGNFLTPDEQYIHGGQFIQDQMSNVGTGNTTIPDYRAAWDMQFDPTNIAFQDDMASGDAGEAQMNYIIGNITNTLAPTIGPQNTAYLVGMVENAYDDYVFRIANGELSPNMGFTDYLNSIGAGDWF